MNIEPGLYLVLVAAIIIIALSVLLSIVPVMLWISALASGVRISIITLIAMRLRRVTPSRIVNPMIKATKAGIDLSVNQLESHFLAGGNVDRVVNALIAAHRAKIHLEFEACSGYRSCRAGCLVSCSNECKSSCH